MSNILVLHGPNLNLLGEREPSQYGHITLQDLDQQLNSLAARLDHHLDCQQSNTEGQLCDWIHQAKSKPYHLIIINAAALTHTSIVLRDALLAVAIPFIEVHLSNLHQRESFRHHSYLTDIALGVVMGFGVYSYHAALHAAHHYLSSPTGGR